MADKKLNITPYYTTPDGRATIYCGDCIDIIQQLSGIDAVVTDPPYGINYVHGGSGQGFKNVKTNQKPIIGDSKPFDPAPLMSIIGRGKNTKHAVLFGANHYSDKLPPGHFLCWDKSCGQGSTANFVDAEYMWTNRRNARCIYRQFWMGCQRSGEGASAKMKRTHPSQKPVELMMWCIETCRIGLGKTILDPYMGSGTTGVACLRTGRKFIGIELDQEYCEIAATRIKKEYDLQEARLTTD